MCEHVPVLRISTRRDALSGVIRVLNNFVTTVLISFVQCATRLPVLRATMSTICAFIVVHISAVGHKSCQRSWQSVHMSNCKAD